MKSLPLRAIAVAVVAVVASLAMARAASTPAPIAPDKLVILSTVDVKGKTGPCG